MQANSALLAPNVASSQFKGCSVELSQAVRDIDSEVDEAQAPHLYETVGRPEAVCRKATILARHEAPVPRVQG